MKRRSRWLVPYLATVMAFGLRWWLKTIRLHLACKDGRVHPADPTGERYIYAAWHEVILAPLALKWKGRVLVSEHTDGELLTEICKRFDLGAVRGSNTRGGTRALLEIIRSSECGHLGVTPDGPQGPRRKLKPGLIMAAAYTGMAIVPIGIAFGRAWRCDSWDRFAIPLPGSSMVILFGEPIVVPKDIARRALRQWTELVEGRFAELTAEAEAWISRLQSEGRRAAPPVPNTPALLRHSA